MSPQRPQAAQDNVFISPMSTSTAYNGRSCLDASGSAAAAMARPWAGAPARRNPLLCAWLLSRRQCRK